MLKPELVGNTLYNEPLEVAIFGEYVTSNPKIMQLRTDPELIVREPEEVHLFGDDTDEQLLSYMDNQFRKYGEALRHLDAYYSLRSAGFITALDFKQKSDTTTVALYSVANNKVHGTYFALEHLQEAGEPEYQLDKITEAKVVSTFDAILRYYEDVLNGKMDFYVDDIRLGNLIVGRLQGDNQDDVYMFDVEPYRLVDMSTPEAYNAIISLTRPVGDGINLRWDLAAMKQTYKKDYPEFKERLDKLLEAAKSKTFL